MLKASPPKSNSHSHAVPPWGTHPPKALGKAKGDPVQSVTGKNSSMDSHEALASKDKKELSSFGVSRLAAVS